jgi:hypothetical protein
LAVIVTLHVSVPLQVVPQLIPDGLLVTVPDGAADSIKLGSWRPPRTWQFWLVRDSIRRVRDGGGECGARLDFST